MFWKKAKSEQIDKEPIYAPKPISQSIVAVIEQIHNEFDTAADKALAEALHILSANSKCDQQRVKLLKRCGFNQVNEVELSDAEESIRRKQEDRATIVNKYRTLYPNNKFIFKEQVTAICEKYGLVCGEVGIYKGQVPTKNLQEIADFKARRKDTYYIEQRNSHMSNGDVFSASDYRIKDGAYIDNERKIDTGLDSPYYFTTSRFSSCGSYYNSVPLYICAPKADMNTENKVMKGVFATNPVPDPIVLHYVKDGFLIVSKWGLEGQDQMLVNETHN